MSRGRPRHQGSRRRAYSGRQREVRERRLRAAREEQSWLTHQATAEEAQPADPEPPMWALRLDGRSSLA